MKTLFSPEIIHAGRDFLSSGVSKYFIMSDYSLALFTRLHLWQKAAGSFLSIKKGSSDNSRLKVEQ
jgi:hypothetical protein